MTTLIRPTTKPIDIDSAPRSAFLFAATAKMGDNTSEGDAKVLKVAITLVARTKDPIDHWYWGRMVHDFAGMTHRDTIPIDLQHDCCDPIGYVNVFEVNDEGLVLSGELVAITGDDDDQAMKVILKGQAGVPYQASIDFDAYSVVLEYVPEGFTSEANGRTYDGPLTILRQWDLQGVAVCLKPWDTGTEARFSKDAQDAPQVPLNWKDKGKFAMTTTNTETKPADAKPAESIEDVRGQFAKTREKFVGMFGAVDGNEYLAAGKPYENALEEHIGKLSKQVETEKARADEAETKLKAAQFSNGEPAPIDTGAKGGNGGNGDKAAAGLLGMIKPKGGK